jgi:hypothetical protein
VRPRHLAALFVALSAFLCSTADAQRRQGNLILHGEHPGAEVYVDAERVGEMPLDPLPLEPGNHTLRVVRPGYTEYTDVFRIRPRRDTEVTIDLIAISMALSVTSVPEGARIFLDDNFSGEAPLRLELLEGNHTIRAELRGYHDASEDIAAVPGFEQSLELTLEELPEEEQRALFEAAEPEWYEEPLTWIIVGGGAAAVALGIVLIVLLTGSSDSDRDQFCAGERCVVDLHHGS